MKSLKKIGSVIIIGEEASEYNDFGLDINLIAKLIFALEHEGVVVKISVSRLSDLPKTSAASEAIILNTERRGK